MLDFCDVNDSLINVIYCDFLKCKLLIIYFEIVKFYLVLCVFFVNVECDLIVMILDILLEYVRREVGFFYWLWCIVLLIDSI